MFDAATNCNHKEHVMSAYAIGHLHNVTMGPGIVEYLRRIDGTLEPFGGQFIIHGGSVEVLEGSWSGDLIVIAFPDIGRARAWYSSAAYQEILPLRRDNAEGAIVIMDGVPPTHRATDILAA
jgi:uncharacterized protein (DUF1330 family)